MVNQIASEPTGRNNNLLSVIPALTGSGAYAANEAVGPLLQFNNGANSGEIRQAIITDNIGQNIALDLYLFNAAIAAILDQASFSLAKADVQKLIRKIQFTSAGYAAIGAGTQTLCQVAALTVPYSLAANGTTLYGQLVVNTGTPTWTHVDDLKVSLAVQSD